ncbi:uncharacterized protein LOC106637475 [Copidosoma floridanum]|uniref:uncharacterized protein LOC106637475 n=1 Tax=Copidosoma floridanum TaxID=29053 RepID=UPI0006C9D726|nr:uncharacterized protein LOC106637475 [Copidosoma floridanum]
MADLADFKFWLKQLECPESLISDYVIHTLQKGVFGLIWEDTPKVIRAHSEVSDARKNILLYKLKHEPKDALIQSIKSTVKLKDEKKRLDAKIKDAEERWKRQEFSCRKKVNLLEKKKADKRTILLKKETLKIKHEQMQVQISNCAKMQEICNHLMPPSVEEISSATITDCLSLVSNYFSGPSKRQTWNRIAELLTPIKIPVLWDALLKARLHYTNLLIHLDTEEFDENTNNTRANIDICISKLCNEHLENVAMRIIHNARTKNSEETIMFYIKKIEDIIEKQRPDLNDWLPLALEVRKLEVLQSELQKEVEKLEEQLPIDTVIEDDVLEQLTSQIKTMDSKTADCVQEIKIAFGRLKSSGLLITKTRECLSSELEKLQLVLTSEESNWSDIDLSSELVVFNNEIDVNALRKIILKSGKGAYKHLRTCLNQAPIVVEIKNRNDSITNLPILRVPIYYLVDLYKTFIVNVTLGRQINEENLDVQDDDSLEQLKNRPLTDICSSSILQLLRLTDETNQRTLQHVDEFEHILRTWSNQTVQETVTRIFGDQVVFGYKLEEWQRRFNSLVYVLQKSNINFV